MSVTWADSKEAQRILDVVRLRDGDTFLVDEALAILATAESKLSGGGVCHALLDAWETYGKTDDVVEVVEALSAYWAFGDRLADAERVAKEGGRPWVSPFQIMYLEGEERRADSASIAKQLSRTGEVHVVELAYGVKSIFSDRFPCADDSEYPVGSLWTVASDVNEATYVCTDNRDGRATWLLTPMLTEQG